jgi:hypothetical protein
MAINTNNIVKGAVDLPKEIREAFLQVDQHLIKH